MKWVEVIKVRTAGEVPEWVKGLLSELLKNSPPGMPEARIYHHALWETDWSLHLLWESEKPEKNGSTLGLRLSQALKEFGLVDHSIWVEEDRIDLTRRQER